MKGDSFSASGRYTYDPLRTFIIGIGLLFFFMAVSALSAEGIWRAFTGGSLASGGVESLKNTDYSERQLFRIIQGLSLLLMFAVPALIWARIENEKIRFPLLLEKRVNLKSLAWAMLAMVVALPFIESLQFSPEMLDNLGFENIRDDVERMEKSAMAQIELMLRDRDFVSLALTSLVISVIPAVAEELFFRGFLLNNLRRLMNVHLAVWLSAAIFSFIHFQFLGFIPRMLLGAFMAYMVVWSGSLWYAISAHFANNFINVIGVIAVHPDDGEQQIDSEFGFSLPFVIASVVLAAAGLYRFYRLQPEKKREINVEGEDE